MCQGDVSIGQLKPIQNVTISPKILMTCSRVSIFKHSGPKTWSGLGLVKVALQTVIVSSKSQANDASPLI